MPPGDRSKNVPWPNHVIARRASVPRTGLCGISGLPSGLLHDNIEPIAYHDNADFH